MIFPMIILLKTVVVPILEYACVVWSPNESQLISLLESVKRKFTSRIAEFNTYDETTKMHICQVNYWERLKKLKIYSLERRRERYMILFLHKILIGVYPNPGMDLTINPNSRLGITIKPKIDLRAPDWVKTVRGASFFNKAPQLFNILPIELRQPKYHVNPTPKNIRKFKKGVDNYLVTVPDQPTTPGLKRPTSISNSILFQNKNRTSTASCEPPDSDTE